MATDNYLSGKQGSVSYNSNSYSFAEWRLAMKAILPKITNFTTAGFGAYIVGVFEAGITLSGPYNYGNMGFSLGGVLGTGGAAATPGSLSLPNASNTPTAPGPYQITLGFTSAINIVVQALIESIDIDNKVEDGPKITVSAKSTGSFQAAII
jgi:hypothetical protein